MDVRIASRVDVAKRAIDDPGNLQPDDELRSFEVSGRSRLDPAVAGLNQQQRNPAYLQFGPGTDHQIRTAGARNQARACFDAMRILLGGGRVVHIDLVATQFLRQRAPFGLAGKNIERRRGRK